MFHEGEEEEEGSQQGDRPSWWGGSSTPTTAKMVVDEQEWYDWEVLRQNFTLFLRDWEDIAHTFGLELPQYKALWALRSAMLDRVHYPTPMTTLAHRVVRAENTTVELVDRLVEKGLVTRSKDMADGRRRHVFLTEEGKRIIEQSMLLHRERISRRGPALIDALQTVLARQEEEQEEEEEERA